MTTHQDTSTERVDTLIKRLRYMGRQYSAGQYARGGGAQKHYLEDAADEIERLRAALASRDGAAQQPQRQTQDHSKLLKMIAHRARCFPSYPMGYHLPEVFAAVGEAPPEHTVPVPQGQAVSDEQIEKLAHRMCWQYRHSTDPHHSSTYKFNLMTLMDYSRAILSLRDKDVQRVPLSGWQPIETAPKDGTEILLLFSKSEYIVGKPHGRVRAACWSGSGPSANWSIPYFRDNAPTHWQPLPTPPNGITSKEQGNGN